jgi:hypothetical protein
LVRKLSVTSDPRRHDAVRFGFNEVVTDAVGQRLESQLQQGGVRDA